MPIQENYCYAAKKDFKVGDYNFKAGEQIEIYHFKGEYVHFSRKYSWDDNNEPAPLLKSELINYLDMSTGYEFYGTCENCGCDLGYMPGASGVGYVCNPCAHKLRGEWEL